MARSPYYSVVIKDTLEDITDHVQDFAHELAVDIDNLLTLTVRTNNTRILDDLNIIEGTLLIFQYGYIGEKLSPRYTARVVDITSTYSAILSIKIQATDLGILLKKNESKKVYEDKTVSDVVKEIAVLNGLTAVVDNTTTIHEFLPQGGRTDYDFLKYLTTIEDSGSFRFYLQDDTIHFTKLDLKKPSIRTFTYATADNEVITFRPSSKETRKKGASRNTVVTYVDPLTGEIIQESIANTNSAEDTKLGDYVIHFNENGEEINRTPSKAKEQINDENRAGKHLNKPVASIDEAKNQANKEKKNVSLEDVTAELVVEGNPQYIADEIISMANVSKKDLGNWYIKRATHSLSQSGGYITRMAMLRNAIKKASNTDTTQQADTNSTTGSEAGNIPRKIKVKLFDKEGTFVEEKLR